MARNRDLTTSVNDSKLIESIKGSEFVIGELPDALNRPYTFVVNRSFTKLATAKIALKALARRIHESSKQTGKPKPLANFDKNQRSVTVELPPGDGRLLLLH